MNTPIEAACWRPLSLVLAIAVTLQLSACGGAKNANNTTGTQSQAVQAFCTQWQSAITDMYSRCVAEPKSAEGDGFGVGYCQDLATAVAAKRVAFDASAGQACLDKLAKAACTASSMYPTSDPCTKVIRGLVADGGACGGGMDCGGGSYCDFSGGTCPGTCTAEVKAGGDCSGGQVCTGGTYCDGKVCQAYVAQGGSCDAQNGPWCQNGLYCDGSGTCAPQVADGGACTTDLACPFPDACYSGTCGKIHGVGESCTGYNNCGGALYCSSGQCKEMPLSSGPCGYITDGYVACVGSGSYCHITDFNAYTGTCAPQATAGQACDPQQYGPCHDGYCDATTKVCVAACHEGSVK